MKILKLPTEDFEITDEDNPAFALDIEGQTFIYEGEFRYPLIRTPREELRLSLGFRHRDGESVILDTITVPSVTGVVQFSQDSCAAIAPVLGPHDHNSAWAHPSLTRRITPHQTPTVSFLPGGDRCNESGY